MANTENCPIDHLSSKEETTNYCRIILLMVDVGTETLLRLFYSRVPKHTVNGFFRSKNLEIEEGKKKKVFDKSQYSKLTCPDPNPDEFDISLLIKLMTYFKLSPVKLDNLQTIRNGIVGHTHRAGLITTEFQKQWGNVENILINIARCVSVDEEQITKVKITELKEKVLDVSDREKKIIKIFEAWCHEQITVLHEKSHRNTEQIEVLQDNMQYLYEKVNESGNPANRQYELIDKRMYCTDDEIVLVLQQDLIAYYRKWFSRLTVSPLIDEYEYAVDFLEIYVKPILEIPSHQDSMVQSQSMHVKSCHDTFMKDSTPCQNIYISSPAGCGKTSLAWWLALAWCQAHQPIMADNKWFIAEDVDEMRTFIVLFIVCLRDEHEKECDVDMMIQNQLFPKLANSTTYREKGLKWLQKLLSSVKCIIILDGLDEWSHPHGNECKLHSKQTPYTRARPLCTTLTTSRPWKLDVVGLKPGEIDQKLELNGLEWDLLKHLIGNVVTKMNKIHRKDMKAADFERELQNMKLTDLSKIPVVVMQLLTVWFDIEQIGGSQCEIYLNMIEFLLKRYCKKRKIVSVMEDMEVDDCNRDRQIPKCLQNNMYCKVHMELLTKVATLAYNTLFTDNEETSLVFDSRIAKKYLSDPEIEMSLAVGILTQEKVLGKMSIRESHISFIHKTFQEYLAALYIALSPGTRTNVEEKIKRVSFSIEKILEMSQMFMFLSGLCPEVMVNLNEHLRQTVSEDSVTWRYRETLGLTASTEGGTLYITLKTLKQVQDTMVKCLDECWLNGHKHVTHLPVGDFFIGFNDSQWSDVLKSLVVHNPVCTLDVFGDYSAEKIEDILNSVTVFNSIQKLSLCMVSETFVVQLVSQHKHSLSVRPETWRHLGLVNLQWVKMSGDILCSFVDSILPKSVLVRLEYCTLSQGTKDWKTYIRSHPRLTVDSDEGVDVDHVVNDSFSYNVFLLQFHTNKVQTCCTM